MQKEGEKKLVSKEILEVKKNRLFKIWLKVHVQAVSLIIYPL